MEIKFSMRRAIVSPRFGGSVTVMKLFTTRCVRGPDIACSRFIAPPLPGPAALDFDHDRPAKKCSYHYEYAQRFEIAKRRLQGCSANYIGRYENLEAQ